MKDALWYYRHVVQALQSGVIDVPNPELMASYLAIVLADRAVHETRIDDFEALITRKNS